MSELQGEDLLDEARRAARAGAKPDHNPGLPAESSALLEQAIDARAMDDSGPDEEGETEDETDLDEADFDEAAYDDDRRGTQEALAGRGSPHPPEGDAAAEAISLAPVARLENLPVYNPVPGLAEPLHLRSPERFLAPAAESLLEIRKGAAGQVPEPATTMQPWAETGVSGGRNKRPLDELLAEYAARVAATPGARAGIPAGRPPGEVYLDRFRGGAARSSGGRAAAAAGGQGTGSAESSGGRTERSGRRGRRGRGAERGGGTQHAVSRRGDDPGRGGSGPVVGRDTQASAGPTAPTQPAAGDGGSRPSRRSGGRRRGGGSSGGQPPGRNQTNQGAPASGEMTRAAESAAAPTEAGNAAGRSRPRHRSRGRGRGRGGSEGGSPGGARPGSQNSGGPNSGGGHPGG
ncbi:MAG: hypothetical protein ABR541_07565 [Candidatus Dormibacteria bacterium]